MDSAAELRGRVAVVTGAASGIGRSIAEALASDGASVVVADLDLPAAHDAASSIGGESGRRVDVVARRVDVADGASCRELVASVLDEVGHIDILVNCAGLQHISPIVDFDSDRWEHLVRVMLFGPFHLTRAVLPQMVERRWGRIVNIGSIHSLVASPNKSAYVAAKHGLLGLTRAVALEAGGSGVTCNLIAPAYVRTPLVEGQIADQARVLGLAEEDVLERVMLEPSAVRRLIEPHEVAAFARFLCSEAAASVTGAAHVMDGGWTAR
jgi:3-hydroxybutyrate dehydrogenase